LIIFIILLQERENADRVANAKSKLCYKQNEELLELRKKVKLLEEQMCTFNIREGNNSSIKTWLNEVTCKKSEQQPKITRLLEYKPKTKIMHFRNCAA